MRTARHCYHNLQASEVGHARSVTAGIFRFDGRQIFPLVVSLKRLKRFQTCQVRRRTKGMLIYLLDSAESDNSFVRNPLMFQRMQSILHPVSEDAIRHFRFVPGLVWVVLGWSFWIMDEAR